MANEKLDRVFYCPIKFIFVVLTTLEKFCLFRPLQKLLRPLQKIMRKACKLALKLQRFGCRSVNH